MLRLPLAPGPRRVAGEGPSAPGGSRDLFNSLMVSDGMCCISAGGLLVSTVLCQQFGMFIALIYS